METLPLEFSEFLRLLTRHGVRHLVIGGYAVSYYGYSRFTADMDIWIEVNEDAADGVVSALKEFGFDDPGLTRDLFLSPGRITRMGVPPMRLEILTRIDGVEFDPCYEARETAEIDGERIAFISLDHLKRNKAASGRTKDLADLENL